MKTDFSRNHDQTSVSITPLGAAIVEAMPDRKKMGRIQHAFKESRRCPVSELFTEKEITDYYHGEVIPVKPKD